MTGVRVVPEILYLTANGLADDHSPLMTLNKLVITKLKEYPEMEISGKLQMIQYVEIASNQKVTSSIRYVQTLRKIPDGG